MRSTQKRNHYTGTILSGLVVGAAASVAVMLLGSAICAVLISRELVNQARMNYYVLGILLLSAIAGAMSAAWKTGEKRLLVCMMTGVVYLFLLLSMTAILFDGRYQGVGVTTLVIFAGSLVAALVGLKEKRRTSLRKSKKQYR